MRKFTTTHLLLILVGVIFVIAIAVFLGSSDDGGPTGWEVLGTMMPSFWTWAILGFLVAVVAGYFAWANATGNGLGNRLPGTDGFTYLLLIIMLIALCGPWGVACTKKANGGVKIETHQPSLA